MPRETSLGDARLAFGQPPKTGLRRLDIETQLAATNGRQTGGVDWDARVSGQEDTP